MENNLLKDQTNDDMDELSTLSLGMAYVPFQKWQQPYEPTVGFERGTIFPALDKPFIGEEAVSNE